MEAQDVVEEAVDLTAELPSDSPAPVVFKQSYPAKIRRDENGRFVRGTAPGPGRRKLQDITPVLESINRYFPPERIGQLLNDLYFDDSTSNKGRLQILQLVLEHGYGKPIQRQMTLHSSLDRFIEAIGDPQEDVIDAESEADRP